MWSEYILITSKGRDKLCRAGKTLLDLVLAAEKKGKTQKDIYKLALRRFPKIVKENLQQGSTDPSRGGWERLKYILRSSDYLFSKESSEKLLKVINQLEKDNKVDFKKDLAEPAWNESAGYFIWWEAPK